MLSLLASPLLPPVAIPALVRTRGTLSSSGMLLALWSIGSMVGGLTYGARHWPGSGGVALGAARAGMIVDRGGIGAAVLMSSALVLVARIIAALGRVP